MSRVGVLEVSLKCAAELKNVEWVGKQDPYCVLKCEGQQSRSTTHTDGGRSPAWNQTFTFKQVTDASLLRVEVYDENQLFRDVQIGTCKVALRKVAQNGYEEVEAPVVTKKGKARGYLKLGLKFSPATSSGGSVTTAEVPNRRPAPGKWILPAYGGKNVKDDYVFGTKLGEGTFGTTYLVQSISKKERLACKTINKKKITSPEEMEDVRREVQVMHHLGGHPHIVQLVGVYEDAQSVHLVLELCTGGELFDRIVKQSGGYSERDAATIMRTLVSVVAYCHRMGVMHRDLKPENFLLATKAAEAPIKVTDFGMSVFITESGELSDLVGSAYYMAPEVLKRRYGREADVWSCGVIMYILLCGVPPFYGENEKQIFESVAKDSVDFRSQPWPRISDAAKDCIRRMLDRDVRRRATAEQVLEHEWMRENGVAPDTPLELEVLGRIQNFSGMNRLKKEALKVIARNLPLDEIQGMREMFRAMDKDGSGTITADELRQGLQQQGTRLPESEITALLANSDVNGDGHIDYEEFVAATLNLGKLQREERLKTAFMAFDLDGNGKLTLSELRQALEGEGIQDVQDIIAAADRDGDGSIDYFEFCEMMREV